MINENDFTIGPLDSEENNIHVFGGGKHFNSHNHPDTSVNRMGSLGNEVEVGNGLFKIEQVEKIEVRYTVCNHSKDAQSSNEGLWNVPLNQNGHQKLTQKRFFSAKHVNSGDTNENEKMDDGWNSRNEDNSEAKVQKVIGARDPIGSDFLNNDQSLKVSNSNATTIKKSEINEVAQDWKLETSNIRGSETSEKPPLKKKTTLRPKASFKPLGGSFQFSNCDYDLLNSSSRCWYSTKYSTQSRIMEKSLALELQEGSPGSNFKDEDFPHLKSSILGHKKFKSDRDIKKL